MKWTGVLFLVNALIVILKHLVRLENFPRRVGLGHQPLSLKGEGRIRLKREVPSCPHPTLTAPCWYRESGWQASKKKGRCALLVHRSVFPMPPPLRLGSASPLPPTAKQAITKSAVYYPNCRDAPLPFNQR